MLILLCCGAVPVIALSCLFCCGVVFVMLLGLRCHSALLLKCFCACIAGLLCSCCLALIVGAMLRLCNCKFNLQCLFCCAGVLIEMFCLPCAVVLPTLYSCMVMLLCLLLGRRACVAMLLLALLLFL